MSETGTFRTSLSGFNKIDVLKFIDELNAGHAAEIEELRREAEEARDRLAAQTERLEESDAALQRSAGQLDEWTQKCAALEEQAAQADELRRQLAEAEALRRENRQLRDQLAGMRLLADSAAQLQEQADEARAALDNERAARERERTAAESEAEEQRRQIEQLKERLEYETTLRQGDDQEAQALRDVNAELEARAAEQEERVTRLEEANRSYEDLVGDIGSFIMEIRAMGQRYLESSYKRAGACLDAAEGAFSALESGVAAARGDMDQARQRLEEGGAAAELRLEEWARELERSGMTAAAYAGGEPETEPEDEPDAASDDAPDDASETGESASRFFR